MKVAVTGHRGFVGQHLVPRIVADGGTIVPLVHGDFGTPIEAERIAARLRETLPDAIIHLAGLAEAPSLAELYAVNVGYAAALFEAVDKAKLKGIPIVVIGTAAEYGGAQKFPVEEGAVAKPESVYGASKLAQTRLALLMARQGHAVVVARPFNVIGPGMGAHISVQAFAKQIAAVPPGGKGELRTGRLDSRRDFVAVQDVARAVAELARTPGAYGTIVNICTGKAIALEEVARTLVDSSDATIELRSQTVRKGAGDFDVHYGNPARMHELLGWTPRMDLKSCLREILRHERGRARNGGKA